MDSGEGARGDSRARFVAILCRESGAAGRSTYGRPVMISISPGACEPFCIARQATGLTREQAANACEMGRIGADPSIGELWRSHRSRLTNGIAIMAVFVAAIQPSIVLFPLTFYFA
jgi:hypothetical protein